MNELDENEEDNDFRIQEYWAIERVFLDAIIEAEIRDLTWNGINGRFKNIIKHEIKEYKEIIRKCYLQQGKECTDEMIEENLEYVKNRKEFNLEEAEEWERNGTPLDLDSKK